MWHMESQITAVKLRNKSSLEIKFPITLANMCCYDLSREFSISDTEALRL